MTFGKIIKELRRKADMTQEQLAEILSISGQAVSRWENDIAMPDISLLPVLANLFEVTTDYLLGVDIARKEEKVEKIIQDSLERANLGYKKEAADMVRAGLKEYPQNYKLIGWLLYHLDHYSYQCEGEERAGVLKEEVSLGERILDGCTDDMFRYRAIECLCHAYTEFGETDKAKRMVGSLPDVWACRETLLTRISRGNEQYDAKRNQLKSVLNAAIIGFNGLNTELDDGTLALSPEEAITIYKNALLLTDMLCPDGDYGFYGLGRLNAYTRLASVCFETGEMQSGIDYLKEAAEWAVVFDTDSDSKQVHTSLLLKGQPYGFVSYGNVDSMSLCLLNGLKKEGYYEKVLETEKGKKILQTLEEHAFQRQKV